MRMCTFGGRAHVVASQGSITSAALAVLMKEQYHAPKHLEGMSSVLEMT